MYKLTFAQQKSIRKDLTKLATLILRRLKKLLKMGSEAILVFFIAGVVLVAGANFLSNLISHKSDNPQKREP